MRPHGSGFWSVAEIQRSRCSLRSPVCGPPHRHGSSDLCESSLHATVRTRYRHQMGPEPIVSSSYKSAALLLPALNAYLCQIAETDESRRSVMSRRGNAGSVFASEYPKPRKRLRTRPGFPSLMKVLGPSRSYSPQPVMTSPKIDKVPQAANLRNVRLGRCFPGCIPLSE